MMPELPQSLNDLLQGTYWGQTLVQWALATLIVLGGAAALRFFSVLIASRLARLASRTGTRIDDAIALAIGKTRLFLVVAVALYATTLVLTLAPATIATLRTVLVVALLLQGGMWASTLLGALVERVRQDKLAVDPAGATGLTALHLIGRILLWIAVLLVALENLGVDVTALVAGLGVTGIAVALALQNVLGDVFASISILLDKPFVAGDFIIVGDFMGTVEHIGLKTTRVRSLGGEQLVFSNNDLLQSRIRNYKRMQERRVLFTTDVVYDTAPDTLVRIPGILREIVESTEQTRFDRAHFKQLGESSLVFEVVYYVMSADYNIYMDVQQAINLAIMKRLSEIGVQFAFPTRTLYVHEISPESVQDPSSSGSADDGPGKKIAALP